jgi:hypothetical protein
MIVLTGCMQSYVPRAHGPSEVKGPLKERVASSFGIFLHWNSDILILWANPEMDSIFLLSEFFAFMRHYEMVSTNLTRMSYFNLTRKF